MVNGLGVLGWGVGRHRGRGRDARPADVDAVPQVVGFKLTARCREGATATDLVLTVTEMLRKTGVVGKFVEFFGAGVARAAARRPRDDREHVARVRRDVRLLPRRRRDARYLRADRPQPRSSVALVEAYCKENMLWHDPSEPRRTRRSSSSTSATSSRRSPARAPAGPRAAADAKQLVHRGARLVRRRLPNGSHDKALADTFPARTRRPSSSRRRAPEPGGGRRAPTAHARTRRSPPRHARRRRRVRARPRLGRDRRDHESCTNTSNPSVMIAAGLLAKKAVERGLTRKPWVKTSLAPGSKVVTEYYERAGLTDVPRRARLQLVGYGCTTCIGNSGPLPDEISERDRRGRPRRLLGALGQPQLRGPHPSRREGELPRVAAARRRLRARRDDGHRPRDRAARPGIGRRDVYLRDIWPTARRSPRRSRVVRCARACSSSTYGDVFTGDERWRALPTSRGRALRLGSRLDLRAPAAVLRRDVARAGAVADVGARACSRARRQRHDRPHLAGRLDQARVARPGKYLIEHGVERATSTRTARAAATTR
jgi:aconitate hydratase